MFTSPEFVNAEISYRMEQAREAALRAQFRRPLRGRFTRKAPKARSSMITRGTPLSAGT